MDDHELAIMPWIIVLLLAVSFWGFIAFLLTI